MHGDKRWIRDHKGRLKKSSDRTFKDWLGDLNADEYKYYFSRECAECEERRRIHDSQYSWDVKCEACRDIWTKKWYGKGFPGGPRQQWYKTGVPSWFRRKLNRQYRTKVKQMMRDAKYNEELYDVLPPHIRNAAWLWW